MKLLVITQGYPTQTVSVYPFVKQVVEEFSRQGHECYVVSPFSITKNKGFYSFNEEIVIPGHGKIVVLRPNYISLSNLKIFGFSPSTFFRQKAIEKALKKLPAKPDVVYAHFWRSGREIFDYAYKSHLPLFVASGESEIPEADVSTQFIPFYNYVKGVICVSSKNRDESIQKGLAILEKCVVLPNGINPQLFCVKDKLYCRQILGIKEDLFVVAFCGTLTHRKGVKILSDAIEGIKENDVYSIFIGNSGGEDPTCRNILFKGMLLHSQINTYLNAADVFVLPTLHEGCCNAIIEAMACGLPIISSDLPFNYDVLNESNSILVDPNNPYSVKKAIVELRDNIKKRKLLSQGALITANKLTIEWRVRSICEFISSRL